MSWDKVWENKGSKSNRMMNLVSKYVKQNQRRNICMVAFTIINDLIIIMID